VAKKGKKTAVKKAGKKRGKAASRGGRPSLGPVIKAIEGAEGKVRRVGNVDRREKESILRFLGGLKSAVRVFCIPAGRKKRDLPTQVMQFLGSGS
jgi:hypothetical protein